MEIDYNTLHGVDGYMAAFPEQFEPLTPRQREMLANALHQGVLEGDRPTAEDVAHIVPIITGEAPLPTFQDTLDRYYGKKNRADSQPK